MSESLILETAGATSTLCFGSASALLGQLIAGREYIAISDQNVASLYPEYFDAQRSIILMPGEAAKTLQQVEMAYERLYALGCDRSTLLLGVGGGTVSDFTGFVAATYLRGLSCGFVPTTLLAQLDAAVGGKNGINLGTAKNMIGTIRQPEFVIIDSHFLASLPALEFTSGLGELLKYALLEGGTLFEATQEYLQAAAGRSAAGLAEDAVAANRLSALIRAAVAVKVRIVGNDEFERGSRKFLNLGHTLGHAIELLEGIPHGLAVIKGLLFAINFSERYAGLDTVAAARCRQLLTASGQDLQLRADPEKVAGLLLHDKKMGRNKLDFICLSAVGRPVIRPTAPEEILDLLQRSR